MAHGNGFDLGPGDLFNERYEVVRPLSVGGMGAVYEALHVETRRRRALKLMRPELLGDAGARARFKLEAQVAANIESEHIVEVVDAGVDARTGAPFIVMELLRGEDLGAVLGKRGRLSAAEVVDLLAQAARALDRTHAAGIVHRDLKPENLFLTAREDGSARLKVLDFGIAKVIEESRHQTHATASIGTPVFMAPEQISGAPIGPAADVYALGHIAYNLLCGAAYWDTEAGGAGVYALLVKIGAGAPEAAVVRAARAGVALPPAFEAWFQRATALAPEARFRSAGELVTALAGALEVPAPFLGRPALASLPVVEAGPSGTGRGAGNTVYGATVPVGTGPVQRRRWSLFAGAAAFVALGIAAGVVRLVAAGPASDPAAMGQGLGAGPGAGQSATPALGGAPAEAGSSAPGNSAPGSSAPGNSAAPEIGAAPEVPRGGAPGAAPPRVEPAPHGAITAAPSATPTGPASAVDPSAKPSAAASAAPRAPGTSTKGGSALPPGPMPTNPLLTR